MLKMGRTRGTEGKTRIREEGGTHWNVPSVNREDRGRLKVVAAKVDSIQQWRFAVNNET